MHAPSLDQFGQQFANAQAGSDAAMQGLMDDYYGPLTAFFERRGAHDPESSANDALERAIRHGDPDRIDSSPAFRAFLYAIARNQAKNEFRTRERRVVIDLVEEPIDLDQSHAAPSAEAIVFDGVMAEDLLAQVKPEQAEVLELRFIDGYSVKETALLTGKSVPAVNALQRRGLATLRQVVGAVVIVVLVLIGVRHVTEQAENGPVISEDLPSEIGELPADGDGSVENGAPLIVETEEPEEGAAMSGRKSDPETEVAGISTIADVAVAKTPQAQLLEDLLKGLARGDLDVADDVADRPDTALIVPISDTEPARPQPAPESPAGNPDGEAEIDINLPWAPAVGEAAQLPTLPAPLIRPAEPEVPVAPEVVDEVETETPTPAPSSTTSSTTSTTTTSTSTTTAPSSSSTPSSSSAPTTTTAPSDADGDEDESGVIPSSLTEPIGDAFGAIKSLVTSPVSWFDDTTDAIDVSQ